MPSGGNVEAWKIGRLPDPGTVSGPGPARRRAIASCAYVDVWKIGTLTDPVTVSGSCPACRARVSNSTSRHLRLHQSEPPGQPLERLTEDARARAPLPVHRESAQDARLAVGLCVDASDELVPVEQRQHIVAPDPLVGTLVDLEGVVEAEELARLDAVPEHVVDRGQQVGSARPDV